MRPPVLRCSRAPRPCTVAYRPCGFRLSGLGSSTAWAKRAGDTTNGQARGFRQQRSPRKLHHARLGSEVSERVDTRPEEMMTKDYAYAHGWAEERIRLAGLETALDPGTRSHMTRLGVGPG